MINNLTPNATRQKLVYEGFLIPFILITSLFFLWGFAHGCLDVLNKHFQELLNMSKAKSAFVQFVFYGGYFFMAIPAGMLMQRFGYKKGIIFGLLVFAGGAFLMLPATLIQTFRKFPVLPLRNRLRSDMSRNSSQSIHHCSGASGKWCKADQLFPVV